jgi:hypothetical protein
LTLHRTDYTVSTIRGVCQPIISTKEELNMTLWNFRPRVDLVTGIAVGAGVLAAPVVVPMAWSAVRPLLKAMLKGGFILYETGKGTVAAITGGPDTTERQKDAPTQTRQGPARAQTPEREKPALAQLVEEMREREEETTEKTPLHAKQTAPVAGKPKRQRKKAVKKAEEK